MCFGAGFGCGSAGDVLGPIRATAFLGAVPLLLGFAGLLPVCHRWMLNLVPRVDMGNGGLRRSELEGRNGLDQML